METIYEFLAPVESFGCVIWMNPIQVFVHPLSVVLSQFAFVLLVQYQYMNQNKILTRATASYQYALWTFRNSFPTARREILSSCVHHPYNICIKREREFCPGLRIFFGISVQMSMLWRTLVGEILYPVRLSTERTPANANCCFRNKFI